MPLVTANLEECQQRMQANFLAHPKEQRTQILRAALNMKIVLAAPAWSLSAAESPLSWLHQLRHITVQSLGQLE